MSAKAFAKTLLWLLPLALAWGILTVSQSTPPPPPPLPVSSTCQPSAPDVYMGDKPSAFGNDGVAVLATNGVVSQMVCQKGTLEFVAWGTPAEGKYPLMTVSIGSRVLLTARPAGNKEQPQAYQIKVPEAGRVSVAFHDDRYLKEAQPRQDRNLSVMNWLFTEKHH